jgi:hypothetical protein
MKGSIMTEKIQRRGVMAPDVYEPDVLRSVLVRQLVIPVRTANMPGVFIKASDDAGLAAEIMGRENVDTLAVRDGDKVLGVITARSLLSFYSKQRQKEHDYESPARTRRILVHGRKLFRTSRS